jgi:hypothetical protein
MKTKMNVNESITSNFMNRILYALQVIVIAIAIPVLSYMEMTHQQKQEIPSVEKNNAPATGPNAVVLSLK